MVRSSLLKNVLQKNSEASGHEAPKALTSRKGLKEYADSIKTTGGSTIRSVRSIAESVASFYSLMTGGARVPKRRRPEVSRLGVPKFYRKNPKPMLDMEGVKYLNTVELGPWTAAHAKSFRSKEDDTGEAWASLVLYSHASIADPMPIYHGRAKVTGELRINLKKPMSIASIDVWLQGKQESILDPASAPFLNATANIWGPKHGDPRISQDCTKAAPIPFKGKFPAGVYVFPFEFPALPRDVDVFQMDHRLHMPKHANVFLPPVHEVSEVSGWVSWQKYLVGVNIKKQGMDATHEEWDMKFDYFPRSRPLFRPEVPFPLLSDHDEWPSAREEIGGWSLTPFGGRGRFRDQMVEVEGILGIQAPVVYGPGQRVRFTILLWSEDEAVLEAMANQEHVQVDYIRSDIYGLDVLEPHNSARKNRLMLPVGERGHVWRNDDGMATAPTPATRAPLPKDKVKPKVRHTRGHDTEIIRSNYVPKRFVELYNENTNASKDATPRTEVPVYDISSSIGLSEAATLAAEQRYLGDSAESKVHSEDRSVDDGAQMSRTDSDQDATSLARPNREITHAANSEDDEAVARDLNPADSRPTSPTPSLENEGDDGELKGRIIRLDGDIVVPMSMPPSYRYLYAGVQYSIHVLITHPEYSHISPRATGIIAEAPIWIVTDPPQQPGKQNPLHVPVDLSTLPKAGQAIPIPKDAVHFPVVIGDATELPRPTGEGNRTWSYF